MFKRLLFSVSCVVFVANGVALAGLFDSGSDGSDGALSITATTVIDLSLADGTPGNGTFDPALNAVIFNYTTIDITFANVTFINHPSGAPVVWLASGDVTIGPNTGTSIRLDGAFGQTTDNTLRVAASGGPGGFSGGFGGGVRFPNTRFPSGGYGPGGPSIDLDGVGSGSGGSYATQGEVGSGSQNIVLGPTYGNIFLLPLIGGSGGAGGWGNTSTFGGGGGGGGGAILIASSGTITMNGLIRANGNFSNAFPFVGGNGAGGGIRLVANTVVGTGLLQALGSVSNGGIGGDGYIRVEANTISLSSPGTPPFTSDVPGLVFPPIDAPTLTATMVGAQIVPADPTADVEVVDVTINDANPITIQIEATNIPVGTTVDVRVVAKQTANSFVVISTPLAGTLAMSTATADVTFPPGLSDVQLSAFFTPAAALAAPKIPGEKDRRLAKGALKAKSKTGKKPTAVASGSTLKAESAVKQAVARKGAGNALPRYRRVNAIVGVEMGPGQNQMTYTTATGRRVTYPADLLASASRALRVIKTKMSKPAVRGGGH